MTEENYQYRTSQTMLRNLFPGTGEWKIPVIPKFEENSGDFDDLLLIGFDKTHVQDENHLSRMVHFFLYDYRFERVWKNPDADLERLSRYRAVLSPDFSMYLEMAPVMQLYNVFRNRWCGAYWASKGMRVIPTVNWGNESTFDFCFEGIEKGSVVAVSTYMASAHDNREDQKEWFLKGYREMLRRIEPEKIICYNTPFAEMEGNIIPVDYERSSWKYMRFEKKDTEKELESFMIGGRNEPNYDILEPFRIGSTKGGGSAFGGKWRPSPNKPEDQRLIGEPGKVNTTYDKSGYKTQTKIGDDGYAIMERHYTDHNRPGIHTNPHDHMITWEDNRPNFSTYINYPDNVPEFKSCKGEQYMQKYPRAFSDAKFESISDFKGCMRYGGEVVFIWNGVTYCAFGSVLRDGKQMMLISKAYPTEGPADVEMIKKSEKWCNDADEVLEYMVGSDRLRDVITQVEVYERTI